MTTRGEFAVYSIAAGLLALSVAWPITFASHEEMATAPDVGPSHGTAPVQFTEYTRVPAGERKVVRLKAVLAAGNASIPNFDNAVREVDKLLRQAGAQTVLLTSDAQLISGGRGEATGDAIDQALTKLEPQPGEGCLVFVTSHGSEAGLSMSRDRAGGGRLAPERLADILDEHCRGLPTVAILSGCHSGTYVTPLMTAENRIILTAARRDRTSFGCSADFEFTYFDECLIGALKNMDAWVDVFDRTKACVTIKESIKLIGRSYPQSSFGAEVGTLSLR